MATWLGDAGGGPRGGGGGGSVDGGGGVPTPRGAVGVLAPGRWLVPAQGGREWKREKIVFISSWNI